MYEVIKRNGKKVKFDKTKIEEAIKKAFVAVNREYDQSIIDLLVLRTCADFEMKIKDKKVSVEDIQDSVEKTLSESNYSDVAKAYILYRKQREKARNIDSTLLGYNSLVNSYVDLNSSKYYSVGGLVMSTSGAITSNYWLSEIYDEQIANAIKNNEISIKDLDMLTGYSLLLPLDKIIEKGIIGSHDNISSAPSKHLNTLCNQLVNLLSIIQNEWAGPLYLKSFDTLLSKFILIEKLSYKEVKAAIETFIYGINMPTCLGGKTPKINILLDYGKSKEEMMINKAILEILLHGDSNNKAFKNPKFVYLLDKEYKFKYDEVDELLLTYVDNFNEVYFMNKSCAKQLSRQGSIGVVGINAKEDDDLSEVDKKLDIACRSLMLKKEIINRLFKNGLYPYTSNYVSNLNSLYSSIGLSNLDNLSVSLVKHIKEELKSLAKKYDCVYELKLLDTNKASDDLFDDLKEKESIYALFESGSIYNVYLSEEKANNKALGSLIETILDTYKLSCFVLRKNKD